MNKKWMILLAVALLAVGALALTGCDDDDDDAVVAAPTVKPFVHGAIVTESNLNKVARRQTGAYITVSGCSSIPSVTINDTALDLEPEMSVYSGGVGFAGAFEPGDSSSAALVVDLGEDGAPGVATLPILGKSEIVGSYDVDVTPGTSQTFTWTSAANATTYCIQFYFDGSYLDAVGENHYWEKEFSTMTTDTFVTLTADQMFPVSDDVETVTEFWGDIDMTPAVGPVQHGDPQNVTGGCEGFFIGIGEYIDWDLDLVDSGGTKTDREQDCDWMQFYAEQMR